MAITFLNAQFSESSTTVTSRTITKPTGIGSGDALIAIISLLGNAAQTFTVPSGFTPIRNTSGITLGRIVTYVKVAGGSEPANYTFSWTNSDMVVSALLGYSGTHSTSPVSANQGAYNSATDSSIVIPAVTPDTSSDMLLCVYGYADGNALTGSWTPPATMTERLDRSVAGVNAIAGGAAELQLSSTSSTGTKTATFNQNTGYAGGQSIILTPSITADSSSRVGMVGI